MVDKKRHKCDFCEQDGISTEGFEGRLGHVIYACGKCIKERTGNRTKIDADMNLLKKQKKGAE